MLQNWKALAQAQYPWEDEALRFIREGLASSSPIHAWSNFEFMALSGAIYEIDAVIAGPWGIFVVEIKGRPGEISSSGGSWVWTENGKRWTADNSLPLANRKCKELRSLLQRQQAFSGEAVPFIEPLIFCSHESNTLRLQGEQAHRVCLRDGKHGKSPGILAAISRRDCPGLNPFTQAPVQKPQLRAFLRAMDQISRRSSLGRTEIPAVARPHSRARSGHGFLFQSAIGRGPRWDSESAQGRLKGRLQRTSLPRVWGSAEDQLPLCRRALRGKILKQRGVGNKTRRDAECLHTELRQRLQEVGKDDRARRVKEAAGTPEDGAEFASVDLIAKQLLVSAGGKQGSRDRQIIEQYLGWTPFENDPGATRWPTAISPLFRRGATRQKRMD